MCAEIRERYGAQLNKEQDLEKQDTSAPERKREQTNPNTTHTETIKGLTRKQSSQLRNANCNCRQAALFKSSFFQQPVSRDTHNLLID